MKKPTRRNANKALCAYFTSGHRSGQVGIVEGEGVGVCVIIETVDPFLATHDLGCSLR